MKLEGKVAIVTGASANIGGTLARGLAREGAKVACNDINPETAQNTADMIVREGGEAMIIPGDVTDESFVKSAVQQVIDKWGHVDILVNNAVKFITKGILDMSTEEFNEQMQIITTGAFLFSKYTAQEMIKAGNGGAMVNILSTAAWQGQPGNIGYCTGKSAMINFTRSAAMEFAEHHIRVNAITPTATMPDDPAKRAMMDNYIASGKWKDQKFPLIMPFTEVAPMKEVPGPSDYVPTLILLVSEDGRMINGTNISVDAGATAKYWLWNPK
ncbi:MAG: SDR family oxidoreductase [Pseudomonadales bacterium]|nr:SDR family oxidoreductase [Pseudomonadales bacterium]